MFENDNVTMLLFLFNVHTLLMSLLIEIVQWIELIDLLKVFVILQAGLEVPTT